MVLIEELAESAIVIRLQGIRWLRFVTQRRQMAMATDVMQWLGINRAVIMQAKASQAMQRLTKVQ